MRVFLSFQSPENRTAILFFNEMFPLQRFYNFRCRVPPRFASFVIVDDDGVKLAQVELGAFQSCHIF